MKEPTSVGMVNLTEHALRSRSRDKKDRVVLNVACGVFFVTKYCRVPVSWQEGQHVSRLNRSWIGSHYSTTDFTPSSGLPAPAWLASISSLRLNFTPGQPASMLRRFRPPEGVFPRLRLSEEGDQSVALCKVAAIRKHERRCEVSPAAAENRA